LYHLFTEARADRRIPLAREIVEAVNKAQNYTTPDYKIEDNAKPDFVTANVYELMAAYNEYILSDLQKAIKFALDAAKLYEQVGDINRMDRNYFNASTYYIRMGDYEKGIELLLKCHELGTQLNDSVALSSTLNSLGVAYSRWGKSEVAIDYFRKAVEIERPLNRPLQYAGRLSTLARETAFLGNYNEALRLIKEARIHIEKLEGFQREDRIANNYLTMGDIYVEADSLQQAENCYKYAVSAFEKLNRQQLMAASLLSLGRLQLKQHHYAEAIKTLQHCVSISETNNLLPTQQSAQQCLYEAYKQTGNAAQALFYLEQHRILTDSIFKETTQRQISEFQVKYETAEKELEIERQQTEISRHRARQNMFTAVLSAAALLLVLLIYNVRLRNKRNRELAETNATKDKFFSIISHDLKNPALAQRDALQLLLDNSGKWDTVSLSNYYKKLLKSADRQVDLLYTLLGWAQIQTGRMPYNPAPFDLEFLCRNHP
jgi:tetratricopeptide (TPR) repeat protein